MCTEGLVDAFGCKRSRLCTCICRDSERKVREFPPYVREQSSKIFEITILNRHVKADQSREALTSQVTQSRATSSNVEYQLPYVIELTITKMLERFSSIDYQTLQL